MRALWIYECCWATRGLLHRTRPERLIEAMSDKANLKRTLYILVNRVEGLGFRFWILEVQGLRLRDKLGFGVAKSCTT